MCGQRKSICVVKFTKLDEFVFVLTIILASLHSPVGLGKLPGLRANSTHKSTRLVLTMGFCKGITIARVQIRTEID